MTQQEIKPSFSLKYLVLTLVSTFIVSGVGIFISKIYESKPSRQMEISQNDQIDILSNSAFPKDQIEANYYLKGSLKKKVATLFRKVVIIKNSGNEGAENILVSATLAETEAHLVASPIIKTEPTEIINAISVSKSKSGTDKKQTWNISLLNPGESVIFVYFIYSEKKLDSVSLDILPRKKDWIVINKSLLNQKQNDVQNSILMNLGLAIVAPMAFYSFILSLSFPLYRYQWNRRPDLRKKYGTFFTFWNDHSPRDLFKSPVVGTENANPSLQKSPSDESAPRP